MNPTLYGAYKSRPTLFDGLALPAAVNKDELLDLIIQEYGANPVLIYMPEMLEMAISSWSRIYSSDIRGREYSSSTLAIMQPDKANTMTSTKISGTTRLQTLTAFTSPCNFLFYL